MFINYFRKRSIQFREIEKYSNYGIFFISLLSIYWDLFGFENYYPVFSTYFCYFMIDSLFLPYHKKDMILHHGLIMIFLLYSLNSTREFHDQIISVLIQCEYSSLFLSMMKFLKTLVKTKNYYFVTLYLINNICFFVSFFYFRIYNLTYAFYFNPKTRKVFEEKNKNSMTLKLFINSTMLLFTILNYYWMYKICTFLIQRIKQNK